MKGAYVTISLRRVLSFLLAVMMVCTLLPTAAFAEKGTAQPGTEQAAVSTGKEETPKSAAQSPSVKDGKEAAPAEKKDEAEAPAEEKKEAEVPAEEKDEAEAPAEEKESVDDEEEVVSPQSALPGDGNAVDTEDAKVPSTPTAADISGSVIVYLNCGRVNSHRSELPLAESHFTNGLCEASAPVRNSSGKYTSTLTFYGQKYADSLNPAWPAHTLKGAASESLTLTYNSTSKKWTASPKSVTFNVSCPAPKPTKPSGIELYDEFNVYVVCDTDSTAHPAQKITPQPGSFTVGEVEGNETDGYTCTVTVTADAYVRIFRDYYHDSSHALVPTEESTKTFTLTRVGDEWQLPDDLNITFHVKCVPYCFVYYKDGVNDEVVFENQVTRVAMDDPTPAFEGGTTTRENYIFAGWDPEISSTVTGTVTYTATWKEDFNGNGKPDKEEERFTVTYTDGVNGKAFKDQVYENLLPGVDTPAFSGKPTRKGYTFTGWSPKVTDTVTKDVTYTATWKSTNTSGKDKLAKTGDNGLTLIFGGLMLFSLCGAAAVCVYDRKRRHV